MGSFENTNLIIQLIIQIGVVTIGGLMAEKISKLLAMPSTIGYIIFGIIIGPFMLGSISLGSIFSNGLFGEGTGGGHVQVLEYFSNIAAITLLFYSGLETDVNLFLRYSIKGSLIGISEITVSFFRGLPCK